MKKLLAIALLAVMMLALFASCNGDDDYDNGGNGIIDDAESIAGGIEDDLESIVNEIGDDDDNGDDDNGDDD